MFHVLLYKVEGFTLDPKGYNLELYPIGNGDTQWRERVR